MVTLSGTVGWSGDLQGPSGSVELGQLPRSQVKVRITTGPENTVTTWYGGTSLRTARKVAVAPGRAAAVRVAVPSWGEPGPPGRGTDHSPGPAALSSPRGHLTAPWSSPGASTVGGSTPTTGRLMTLTAPPPALIVSDIVGPVLRGEGPSLGRRCTTIRLGGCNLACSWCDSPQDWDGSRFDLSAELSHRLVRNVADDALAGGEGLVVITGGEPLRQQAQEGWPALLHLLAGVEVEVETNGTYLPSDDSLRGVTRFVVSPKLANSGARRGCG